MKTVNLKELLVQAKKAKHLYELVENFDDDKHYRAKYPEYVSGKLQQDIVDYMIRCLEFDPTIIDKIVDLSSGPV